MPFKDREAQRRYQRKQYLSNRDAWLIRSHKTHAKKYGLTLEEYKALRESAQSCEICEIPFKSERKGNTPHIDHDHVSGRIRGLLCSNCNTALGLFGDDVQRLQVAIDYLRRN